MKEHNINEEELGEQTARKFAAETLHSVLAGTMVDWYIVRHRCEQHADG